jgi:hypothetical protein
MAKLALAKEVWLSKDAAWFKLRELDWGKIELRLVLQKRVAYLDNYILVDNCFAISIG